MTLEQLNSAGATEAKQALARCCGSSAWVAAMLAQRPFADPDAVWAAADRADASLGPLDWREAFSHHPRIGGKDALRAKFAETAVWAGREQAATVVADEATLDALADGNRSYEERFGHIFIVCATGRSAAEMLRLLRERLLLDADSELRNAAAEQAKITRLRLARLLEEGP